VAGYQYVPVFGGYAIACFLSIESTKIERSVNEPLFAAKLDPFSIWHEVSVGGSLWRKC
jgi:hypothetical protein